MDLCRIRLINVNGFLERERLIREGEPMDSQTKVFEPGDEATKYAIVSHRWIEGAEVDYQEMTKLAEMKEAKQNEIRERLGYKKIIRSCEQALRDGYKYLWIDTCCINKPDISELSRSIKSMYRWYKNSSVCYAYLHDITDLSFPTASSEKRYPDSKGWPVWFSRGWTLQEMIAPVDVWFFNKDWKALGDKRTLAPTLSRITRVPQHILTDRFSPNNRPCAAQIMSWAADRTTGEVEDKAYSLFGLLGVNIPVMYGEGKEAFRRLQLEFVREANDGSIFAWGFHRDSQRSGSILADDPSFFRGCENMELITPDEYLRHHRFQMPQLWLMPYIRRDRYDPWVMTNRGIQCRTFLRPCVHSRLHFETPLPCRFGPSGPPVSIKLALWQDDFYRYFTSPEEKFPTKFTAR
ncbi:heterokaryon incompatibility protein-domain-containing protein [Pisolithus orientalis]|uniref:heterokaryon incompatibility protein-domain-containing protein n=1 Tax=Pisolithus orientalis TaxID=936130 RepID=UPI002224EE3A|nr:heterokaryon incompatibility protein-domain-containing protein [Pisolithus orientalis]KAI6004437.1 heterokaryon incompatibility protein-domain-containing protein [Pisolithus orientalis]